VLGLYASVATASAAARTIRHELRQQKRSGGRHGDELPEVRVARIGHMVEARPSLTKRRLPLRRGR
jgi:hypothetical protein